MSGERRFPYEKVAKLHAPERLGFQPPDPAVDLLATWAPGTVLDIGVGSGWYALPLAARLPEARIIGLDVEPRMFEVLAERAAATGQTGAVETLAAPPDGIPLPDGTVDAALMANLYHELDDRRGYLAEVRRVLAPGGRLLICDWDPEDPGEVGPPVDHRVPLATVEQELRDSGLSVVTRHDGYRDLYLVSGTAA